MVGERVGVRFIIMKFVNIVICVVILFFRYFGERRGRRLKFFELKLLGKIVYLLFLEKF